MVIEVRLSAKSTGQECLNQVSHFMIDIPFFHNNMVTLTQFIAVKSYAGMSKAWHCGIRLLWPSVYNCKERGDLAKFTQ